MKSVKIQVYGRVQGVWFRGNTQRVAEEHHLKGWVSNLEDGSVYIEVEGAIADVDALIAWCKVGPPYAAVSHIKIIEQEFQGYRDFRIRR